MEDIGGYLIKRSEAGGEVALTMLVPLAEIRTIRDIYGKLKEWERDG